MSESKAYLEATYKLPVYVNWADVPNGLHTKTALKQKGVKKAGEPVAIKGGGMNRTWYFLYRANETTTK